MSKKYIYMLFIFLFFVVTTSIFSLDCFNIEQVREVYNSNDLKCKYRISNIKEEQNNYNILVYYPVTEKDELNNVIMEKINLCIEKFKKELNGESNDLTVRFNSFENDKYTSFLFEVAVKNNEAHEREYVFTCNYDNDKNKVVTIDDLLQLSNDSLSKISNAIFNNLKQQESIKNNVGEKIIEEYLNSDKEKYECFYFAKESVVFCFNIDTLAPKSAGVMYAYISYDDII